MEAAIVAPPETPMAGFVKPVGFATVGIATLVLAHCGGRCCMGTSTGCVWPLQAVAVLALEGDGFVGHPLVGMLDWV